MLKMNQITASLLDEMRKYLFYNPITGDFTRIFGRQGCNNREQLSCKNKDGYLRIKFNGIDYLAHRIGYAMIYGCIESNLVIDHIDGNKNNNSIYNLRAISLKENLHNRRASVKAKSGVLGVYPITRKSGIVKYVVYISTKRLGTFNTIEDAIEARKNAELIYFPTKPQ